MKVTMVVVSSVDGKITRGDEQDIYKWTSPEDQSHFFQLIEENNVIVMGSGTYQVVKKSIKLRPDKLRIVLTHHPHTYDSKTVKGQLEFSSETPQELVTRLEKKGYSQLLLVGGSTVNRLFLEKNLVDELYLTIEPFIFGEGKNIIDQKLSTELKLVSTRQLNAKGTILNRYQIIK